jgi:tetratricopeptide (TPR) repeat protein
MLERAAQKEFSDPHKYLPRPDAHSTVKDRLIMLLCPDGRWNELHIHGIIQTLQSFSLISITSISATLYLQFHKLVHAWSRDILSSSDIVNYRLMATQVVVSCTSWDDILLYQFLLPHAMKQVESEPIMDLHLNDQMGFGCLFGELGNYSRAEMLFQGALHKLEEKLGKDDGNTLKASGQLASLYRKQGKWTEAERIEVEVLEQRQRLFGKDNSHTINAAANLAITYWEQGKWREAERMEVEVLEQSQRLFGKDNPDTISAAATYQQQGRWRDDTVPKISIQSSLINSVSNARRFKSQL